MYYIFHTEKINLRNYVRHESEVLSVKHQDTRQFNDETQPLVMGNIIFFKG